MRGARMGRGRRFGVLSCDGLTRMCRLGNCDVSWEYLLRVRDVEKIWKAIKNALVKMLTKIVVFIGIGQVKLNF